MAHATLATLIERRKQELGQSDDEAARACRISQATFTRWRTGIVIPLRDDALAVLATWLDLPRAAVDAAATEGRRRRPITPRDLRSVVAETSARVDDLSGQVEALAALVRRALARDGRLR